MCASKRRPCPACKHESAENRRKQAKFACVECGFAEHAELTAAINILRAGHARLACQVNGAIMPSATATHRSDRPYPRGSSRRNLRLFTRKRRPSGRGRGGCQKVMYKPRAFYWSGSDSGPAPIDWSNLLCSVDYTRLNPDPPTNYTVITSTLPVSRL
jgi:hypothetical protein